MDLKQLLENHLLLDFKKQVATHAKTNPGKSVFVSLVFETERDNGETLVSRKMLCIPPEYAKAYLIDNF